MDITLYTIPKNQAIVALDSETAFKSLTKKEKLFAHYMSQAAWNGGLMVFLQTSPESPLIFALLHKIYLAEPIDQLRDAAIGARITEDDFTAFLIYSCGILSNLGNYRFVGSTKIIPDFPKNAFETLMKASKAYKNNPTEMQNIWDNISNAVYSLDGKLKVLGFCGKGVTTYFSANCTEEDSDRVHAFIQHKELESYNARCFKTSDGNVDTYEIRVASLETSDDPAITLPEETYQNAKFKITRGDYGKLMVPIVENLKKAKEYASTNIEKDILNKYVIHFTTGSLDDHTCGYRLSIENINPIVESYLGFVEKRRDPMGQCVEFEGVVGIVNKQMLKKFAKLVRTAEKFIPKLPWGKDFEKDTFSSPDFKSLDILMFAGSNIPLLLNISNYDENIQFDGYKHVVLSNVILAYMKDTEAIPFLSDADQKLIRKYGVSCYEIRVGLLEILGHGTGKLLKQIGPDTYNFDSDNVRNPLTGGKIDKFFLKGETYDSKFGPLACSYEECRAEAVSLYLSLEKDVLKIFGYKGQEVKNMIYVNWLFVLWNAFAETFKMYQPAVDPNATGNWTDAQAQALYVLLRVCLEAGQDFVNIVETEEGKNLLMTVDRSKIFTVGKKAIGDFLLKLQIYKSTGDIESATEMYDRYSEMPDSGSHPFACWRDLILSRTKPKKIVVQSNTFVNDSNNVILKNYEATYSGFIQSWLERFPNSDISQTLIELWNKDKHHFIEK